MTSASSQPAATPGAGAGELRTFVERMSIALYERGLPRMPARVFTILLCSDADSVTAKQLTAALSVSPAAISSAVNYLLELGLIEREPIPGSRQDHYRLPPDGTLGALMRRSEKAPDLAQIAADGVEVLRPGSPGGERLTELAEFVRFLDGEMRGVWERWQARPR